MIMGHAPTCRHSPPFFASPGPIILTIHKLEEFQNPRPNMKDKTAQKSFLDLLFIVNQGNSPFSPSSLMHSADVLVDISSEFKPAYMSQQLRWFMKSIDMFDDLQVVAMPCRNINV